MNSRGLAPILVLSRRAISTFAQATSTQSPSVSFAYPPAESMGSPRLTINILDTVDIEWASNYGQTWLTLWCDEYKPEDGGKKVTYRWLTKEVFASGDTTYRPWDALESDTNDRTGQYPYACHFDLLYNNEEKLGVSGPAINITSRAGESVATTFGRRATQIGTTAPPTSTALSTILGSASQTALSSSSPIATSSPSASATPSNGNNGLSAGAKAGIAIGAVFAVIAAAAIAYLFYRNHRKIKELEARAYPQEVNAEPKAAPIEYYKQDYQPVPPTELGHHRTYELPSQPQELAGGEGVQK